MVLSQHPGNYNDTMIWVACCMADGGDDQTSGSYVGGKQTTLNDVHMTHLNLVNVGAKN